jgi:branched-chain amino acid transport system substrate-binding protein
MLMGGGLVTSDWLAQLGKGRDSRKAFAADPIKVGILDPLTSPYKTSSVHDVHGATVAMESFNKRGGVLGRPVVLIEVDDASSVETAAKAARKLVREDRVDVLMGTFNGEVALAVSELAREADRLFMVTGAHIPELTGARCNSHMFVFMPNARMMARAVAPSLTRTYGKRWYMITAETLDGESASQAMAEALGQQGGEVIGSASTAFGSSDFSAVMTEARKAKPDAVILNLYGWDLVHALRSYATLGLAKDKIGVGGMIGGEQIGRPLGYAHNAGIWGLIWDPKVDTESSKRFIQAVIDKYQHTPTSRCYLGYAAMTQVLEAIQRAGTTDAAALIRALEGHEFDGLKIGKSYFRATDHQHVQDVLIGEAYGKELGLGHYKIMATIGSDAVDQAVDPRCRLV